MKSRCGRRRWLIAYVAGLFLTSALALPCWNAFLRDSLGRFITAEQIHVIEYGGLGWRSGLLPPGNGQAVADPRRPRGAGGNRGTPG